MRLDHIAEVIQAAEAGEGPAQGACRGHHFAIVWG
jgi:hypothetical protein